MEESWNYSNLEGRSRLAVIRPGGLASDAEKGREVITARIAKRKFEAKIGGRPPKRATLEHL